MKELEIDVSVFTFVALFIVASFMGPYKPPSAITKLTDTTFVRATAWSITVCDTATMACKAVKD